MFFVREGIFTIKTDANTHVRNKSISFWENLGFKVISKFSFPYQWAIITDGIAVVGLHQTKQFSLFTITYFANDMKEKIENLKLEGIMEYIKTDS